MDRLAVHLERDQIIGVHRLVDGYAAGERRFVRIAGEMRVGAVVCRVYRARLHTGRGNGIVQIDVAPFDETLDATAANRLATYRTTVIVHPGRAVIFTALNDAMGEKDMSKRGDALLQDRVLLVTVDLE